MPTAFTQRLREGAQLARLSATIVRPRRSLFVLSHMRSYSSLLCHILNSNPDVAGYVELHHAYRRPRDLLALRAKVARINSARLEGRYVLDKILHNQAEVDPSILSRDDVYAIFSIREPEQTLRSTIAMGLLRKDKGWSLDWKSDPRKVTRYYVRRLERLVQLAAKKPKGSIYFDADMLVDHTDVVLADLTRFLGLAQPLRGEYRTFEHTGKHGSGDPGAYITSGAIVRERSDYGGIEIPEKNMIRAREAFEVAREALAARCEIVTGTVQDLPGT